MRKKVNIIQFKTVKGSLRDGVPVKTLVRIMQLSPTTIRRIRAVRSFKAYRLANKARYVPRPGKSTKFIEYGFGKPPKFSKTGINPDTTNRLETDKKPWYKRIFG